MSWSMTSVSYRMSGSGSWQNLLKDELSRQLYSGIYPDGRPLAHFDDQSRRLLISWQQAGIIRIEGQKVAPLGPIMMDDDLAILWPWFQDISNSMCGAVLERISEYRSIAEKLADSKSPARQKIDNILTILICAHTLDSRVFSLLRKELMGTYPPRDFAGNFFFWGYAFSTGPERIFGFTSYGGLRKILLHVIRSHGLDRNTIKALLRRDDVMNYIQSLCSNRLSKDELPLLDTTEKTVCALREAKILDIDDPPRLAIPVFSRLDMGPAIELCNEVSLKIMSRFITGMDELKILVSKRSFGRCAWPDTLCMLFHLAYSYAADKLVERGTIPDFPESAAGEWGIWIH